MKVIIVTIAQMFDQIPNVSGYANIHLVFPNSDTSKRRTNFPMVLGWDKIANHTVGVQEASVDAVDMRIQNMFREF